MSLSTRSMTAEDLWAISQDGSRCELVAGELHRMSPAGFEHGCVAVQFASPLHQHVRAHGLGRVCAAETGFILSRNPDTVRAPDVAFLSNARLAGTDAVKGFWPGAPEMAVEVRSPGDTSPEVDEKVRQWLAAGTLLVVVLDPTARQATVYRPVGEVVRLDADEILDCSDVVPGFSLSL